MKFVLASNNAHKLTEVCEILTPLGIEILSQKQAGISVDPEENGNTFEANALIKARAACQASGLPALADDSGLVVDALGGAPGVYSARYGGEGLDDKKRYELLLANMEGMTERAARFVSCIACVFPNGDELTAQGRCEGTILNAPEGNGGFGYDPVFLSADLNRSMGLLSHEEKNSISHRGRALQKMSCLLRQYMKENDERENNND